MYLLERILRGIQALFRREQTEREMDEELKAYLEAAAKEKMRSGMSREEALRAARVEMGGVEAVKEEIRSAGWESGLEAFWRDLCYGLRNLFRNPAFGAVAITVLALGICASTAIFAFVDAALIKPLPYPDPNRLVDVAERSAMWPRSNLSYQDYLDWKRLNKVFLSLDIWDAGGYLLKTPSGVQPIAATSVSDGFFRTLGVTPFLGRDFYPGEDKPGAPRTAILSYPAWRERFGGRPEAVGQAIELGGIPYTIVGVLPRGFQFALRGQSEIWTPLQPTYPCTQRRSCHNLYGVARLKDGISISAALADMTSIARQLERQYPDSNRGQGASVQRLSEIIVGSVRPVLLVLLGGAGLLLLIACVNVTSLVLARSESRKREIAVRGALGASAGRLVRQFAAEGLVLVSSAALLGLLSAAWLMKLLVRLIPPDMLVGMPYIHGLGLNIHAVTFAAVISLLAAGLFAVTPALRLPAAGLPANLAEGGRGSAGRMWRRLGANLVVVEIVISVVLLASAGLLGKSLYRLLHVELGFQPDHLATMEVTLPDVGYESDARQSGLAREILNRVRALPDVKSASISSMLPVTYNGNTDWVRFLGRPYNGEHNEVNQRDVTPEYFSTLQAKLLRGRFFTEADDASKPRVAIINQAFARKYFPGEDPLGMKYGDNTLSPGSIREIIGVVEDLHEGTLDSEIWPAEYLPFNQNPDTYFCVVARTSQDERSVLATLSAAIHQMDPNVGTLNESAMMDRIHNSPAAYLRRSSLWLVGGFAGVALLLGIAGLYGVVAYSVSQRTREIGVRIALGARRSAVYQLVLGEAAWLVVAGIAAGLACSVAVATLMRSVLFGTDAWDLPTLAAVAVVLAAASLLAAFIPAWRAARVDPVIALRCD